MSPVKDQTEGWDQYYRRARLAGMPELFVVRFFRALRNRGGFLSEHRVDDWTHPTPLSILDFGCGNGRHLLFLAQEGWTVTGCDISAEAVKLAREAARAGGLDARVDVIDDVLPYRDGSFDIVISHGVFDHIPYATRARWRREVCRVLKPGGLLYASFIVSSLHGQGTEPGEEVLEEGEEAGLTQTFYSPEVIQREYGGSFVIRSVAYDNRGLLYPANAVIEHRLWAFLQKPAAAA